MRISASKSMHTSFVYLHGNTHMHKDWASLMACERRHLMRHRSIVDELPSTILTSDTKENLKHSYLKANSKGHGLLVKGLAKVPLLQLHWQATDSAGSKIVRDRSPLCLR